MKNKKGFTLIEIIISISLIAVISTITIIGINNNKNKNSEHLKSLHNKILEAATVFMSIEKDKNGNSYDAALNMGAKGVKIPVNFLVENGYVDKNTIKEVYKLDKLDDTKNYFILAVNGGSEDNQDYCDVGEITLSLSWMDENKPVYLCKNYKKYTETKEVINNIQEVQNNVRLRTNLDKIAISEDYYNSLSEDVKNDYVKDENGLFTLYDSNVDKIYTYYRGSVNNNYLKLGKDSSNNDLIWRIVWMNEDNISKLVLNSEIPLQLTKKNGEIYHVKKDDHVVYFSKAQGYYALNPEIIKTEETKYDIYYTIRYNSENLLEKYSKETDVFSLDIDINKYENIYFNQMLSWYNSTNLKEYEEDEIIETNNNFCKNDRYEDSTPFFKYNPSNTFACVFNNDNGKKDSYIKSSLFYSSPVGFLTYGDAVRAGVGKSIDSGNLVLGNNYLLNDEVNSYPLVDYKQEYEYINKSNGEISKYKSIYYINSTGLNGENFYKINRDNPDVKKNSKYLLCNEKNDCVYNTAVKNTGKDGGIKSDTYFLANSIKPAIIINLTDKKLNGDGTTENPFLVVDKD